MKRLLVSVVMGCALWSASSWGCPEYLTGEYRQLNSQKTVDICALTRGKAVLVVNTASHCGFTGQLKGLEKLHQEFAAQGLVVIGFSSNDFKQEADSEAKAAKVCYANNGVSFTMLAPTQVKGEAANAVFRELAAQSQAPSWNFTKYLIDREGAVVGHYASKVKPSDTVLREKITQILAP